MDWKRVGVVIGAVVAGVTFAATVTVNPPAGTVTNALAFVSGTDSLAVNTGATGGTVHLSPYSTHTGGTTLGSGTLVVAQPVGADETTGELGAGPFVQQGGTLRYAGPAGGVWTRAVTNTASAATAAVVWQIDNDLTMDCDVAQTVGAFVKTGPGTLSFTTNFNFGGTTAVSGGTRRKLMNLSPDRAPTQGHSNFTVVDGTVVIDTAPGDYTTFSVPVTNVLTAAGPSGFMTVGACTTINGTETTGVLEHRSGVTRTGGGLNIGFCNGSTSNSTTPLSPTLRVTGGRLLVGEGIGTNSIYVGVNQDVSTFTGQRNAPVIDVSNAHVEAPSAAYNLICKGLYLAHVSGANTTVRVHDGGHLRAMDGSVYVGNYTTESNPIPTTNLVEVTGEGSWMSFQNFSNDPKKNGMVTTFRIADGGTVEMRNFSNSAKGELHLIVDGGVWRHRNHDSATPHIPSSVTSVKVGPGGFKTYFNNGKEAYPVVFEKGIEPLDDSGTDGGLFVTQAAGAMPPLRLNAVNTYCGPTTISATRVYLGKAGKLPSGTALSVTTGNGGLIVTNGVQTVGSFTFGHDTSAQSPILGFGPGSRLDVTGETHVGAAVSEPKLQLFEKQGGTTGLSSVGTYTYITARAEDVHDLQRLAERFTFPLKPDGVDYTCFVDQEGDRALLKVAVTAAGTPAATTGSMLVVPSALATTNVAAAADVAAARAILANPSDSENGTVELGALAGFGVGGTLTAWGGFTRVSDLSFMQSEANLVLGLGTLVYTGPSAEIPGLTVDAPVNRSGVLSVADPGTTLTIRSLNAVRGSLSKMGPGTLHFGGTGEFMLPTNSVNISNSAGVTAAGDGPAAGFRYFNVNEGRVEIGTVGDPNDAPTLISMEDFSIGSTSHRIGQGIQTTGELVMNNGSLSMSTYFYLGYYCGRYTDCPDIHLYPTLTQNGGEITYTTLRMGHGSTGYYQTASPRLYIHGGTNTCLGTAAYAYSVVPTAGVYRAEVVIDGTGVMRANNAHLGYNDKAAGVDMLVTGNGRLEVSNVLYLAYKNTAETNTFRLTGNGTIRARMITGNHETFAYPVHAWFDGGTVESLVNATENSNFYYLQHAYIGAGGLNFDLSHQADLAGPTTYWLLIRQAFEHDPDLGGTPDGGITFRGAGTATLYTSFENGTFTGPIRAFDDARVQPVADHVAPFALEMAAGTRLRDYDGTGAIMKDLTLGAAGATDPVFLELRRDVPTQGFVVTNSLSVLSPVAVTTSAADHDLSPVVAMGTYTALVYSASCSDVDLSKFTLPAEFAQSATIAVRQVTVDGGDYDGMKAVVVTITSASGTANGNVWTSVTAGGNWNDASNWDDATLGAPNGKGELATFNPATKAGVAVTLDEPVTLGGLVFTDASNAKYGYTLSGQGLTLDDGIGVAAVANAKGTNAIASAVTLSSDAQLQTMAGNELRLTGGVSGTGDLGVNTHVVTNAGQVNLTVAQGYTGKITTASGRVVMDDLSFIQSADQLTLGLGTLLYTGPDVTIPGFHFGAGSGRPAVFESDANVTVSEAITRTGTSAFLKLGSGTLHLNGTGTMSVNTKQDNNDPNKLGLSSSVFKNGDGPTRAVRGFAISDGTFVMGEVDDPANAPTVSETGSTEITVGSPTTKSGSATFVLNNGLCTTTAGFYLGYYAAQSPAGTLTYIQNGGSLQVGGNFYCAYQNTSKQKASTRIEINGGSTWVKSQLYMGRSTANSPASQYCRFVMNGGSFATAGNMHFAYSNSVPRAYIDLNGGILTCSNTLYAAYRGDNDVTVRLNPNGMFRCNAYAATEGNSVTRFYGNGGTFRPLCRTAAAQTMAANIFTHLYASTNGFVVDTSETLNGAPFTMAQPIQHDPDCDGADGGLVKRGAATLTLSGANTYTGGTVVEGGLLALSGNGTLGAGGGLAVARGAICDLGGTAQAVGDVVASGLVRNGSLTVGGAMCATVNDVLAVYGDLAFANTAAVDFATVPNADLAAGVPLAAVSGTATLPERVRALNAGDVRSVTFKQEGNVVYAFPAPSGMTLIIR